MSDGDLLSQISSILPPQLHEHILNYIALEQAAPAAHGTSGTAVGYPELLPSHLCVHSQSQIPDVLSGRGLSVQDGFLTGLEVQVGAASLSHFH